MKEKLQSALSVKRYIHTMGVAEEAVKLAEIYGTAQDRKKAEVAGLLHDCAKNYPNDLKIRLCKEYHIALDDILKEQKDLIHPFLGAEIAKREYLVEDEDILNAIRYHTTGRKEMSLLEKIIFLADYIEPNRATFDGLEEARRLSYLDLDMAMRYTLEHTISYVKQRKLKLHSLSLEALEYFKNK
nr:bis(5'-nucleosyl)-tetraphosphatase (symmetrical) YqeK [Clostridium sp. MD294]